MSYRVGARSGRDAARGAARGPGTLAVDNPRTAGLTANARRRLAGAVVGGAALAGALASCNLADGLQDVGDSLGNPDAALIDAPGRRLASGRFSGLLVDGSLDDGGYVLALERLEDESTQLAVLPYPEGEGCTIAPALEFGRLSSRIDIELPGSFAVQTQSDDDGRGKVLIADFDCETVFELERAFLPRTLFPATAPRGVLTLEDQDRLSLIVPGQKSLTTIAEGVAIANTTGEYLWAVQDGELVVRNDGLEVVARMASNLQSYIPTGGRHITAAIVDDAGLSFWSKESGFRTISDTACAPAFLGNDTLAYLDPCTESKLRILTWGDRIGAGDELVTLDGPSGVTDHGRVAVRWGQDQGPSEVSFLLGPPGSGVGALAVAELAPGPSIDQGHVALEYDVIVDEGVTLRGQELFQNYDGEIGDLSAYERDEEGHIVGLRVLAERVAQLPGGSASSYRGVLYDFDGSVGTLGVLDATEETVERRVLARGVPLQDQSIEGDSSSFAFIGELDDDGLGTLYLSPEDASDESAPAVIDDRVFRNTARFLEQPRGLAYLVRNEKSTGAELRVWLIDSGLTVVVHPRVAEYRTVPWPSPGILYSVIDGDDQGIWYAKAR